MGKFIKYNYKKNKRYFGRILIIHLLFIILALVLKYGLGLQRVFANPVFTEVIYAVGIGMLAILNIIYILTSIYKDLYKADARLNFILPLSSHQIVGAMVLSVGVVYIINLAFLLGFYLILGYHITTPIIFYFLLGLIWTLIFASLAVLFMQMMRFKKTKFPFLIVLAIGIAIFLIAYVFCKYSSFVLVNSAIQHARPMDYAFVYPFAIGNQGLYLNLSPYIYYIVATIIMVFINGSYMENNLELY